MCYNIYTMENNYQLYLTKGLGTYDPNNDFLICSCSTLVDVFKTFHDWKNSDEAKEKYKIGNYDRYIFMKKENAVAIDFGDYSFFGYLTSVENDHVVEDFNAYLKGND